MSRIAVIGAGAFGTALASVLARDDHDVMLWGRDRLQLDMMAKSRCNEKYLPDCVLPDALRIEQDLRKAVDADAVLLVVPAQQLRGFLSNPVMISCKVPLVLCAKGVELGTGHLQSRIVADLAPNAECAVISGPGFASELVIGKPTALSIGCGDTQLGVMLQKMLSTPALRLYLSGDVTGVQLGGALKNVYAIGCGLVVGAGLGESARAALMTRGFAEMSRLGREMGADMETLAGLAGLGDLALSCTSEQSRNFAFGLKLGCEGVFGTGKTVEGVATAEATISVAAQNGVDMPIAQAVADVLKGRLDVKGALHKLMARPLKREAI